jgi:predicted metal-dependent phosphoesterase TrpH
MSEVHFIDTSVLKGRVIGLLKKEGYQTVDMHYHTRHSIDGLATINQVIQKCKKDSLGTAITDHNSISGAIKVSKLKQKKVFVIPGIELTCHNGAHVLLHFPNIKKCKEFYDKEVKKRVKKNPWFLDIDHNEAIETAKDYDCLITLPHPFGPGFCGVQKFGVSKKTLQKVDAIEVINGCCKGNMNPRAIRWAKKIKKGFTGGSDGHCLGEHGTSLTICKAETQEQFLEEIRKKRSIVMGKEEPLLQDGINALHKFFREEKKAPKKQVEQMWKDRFGLEWKYLRKKIGEKSFFQHYHSHHEHPKKTNIEDNRHTKHLSKQL